MCLRAQRGITCDLSKCSNAREKSEFFRLDKSILRTNSSCVIPSRAPCETILRAMPLHWLTTSWRASAALNP
jgi:hypothetical protein